MIYYVYRTRKVICENLIFNWHDFFWKEEIKKKYKERQNEIDFFEMIFFGRKR